MFTNSSTGLSQVVSCDVAANEAGELVASCSFAGQSWSETFSAASRIGKVVEGTVSASENDNGQLSCVASVSYNGMSYSAQRAFTGLCASTLTEYHRVMVNPVTVGGVIKPAVFFAKPGTEVQFEAIPMDGMKVSFVTVVTAVGLLPIPVTHVSGNTYSFIMPAACVIISAAFKPICKPTPAPTATPEPSATPAPSEEPTATPAPTDEPSEEPTATPAPTDEPSEEPTATPAPTDEPSEEPTATPAPTDEPSEEPTATPAPTAKPSDGDSGSTSTPTPAPAAAATAAPVAAANVSPKTGDTNALLIWALAFVTGVSALVVVSRRNKKEND